MSSIVFQEHKFIGHLERLVKEQDRGALAALRRGLGKLPGTAREMDRHVLPYLPSESGVPTSVTEKQEDAYYLIGSLFAYWHQGKDTIGTNLPANIGASLRSLVDREVGDNGSRDDTEKRIGKLLVSLLNCHPDELPDHLRHTISLLKSKDIAINWVQLLWDIQNWYKENRDVQRQWARRFWCNFQNKKETTDVSNK